MINNRQNGRRRGRGGPQVRNGSGNGPERGNRIDNRARGNAAQLHEKYRNLARDAQTQGDRVMTEYYLQFADHYFRVLSESRSRFEEQGQQQGQYQNRRASSPPEEFEEGNYENEGEEGGDAEAGYRDPRRFTRDPRREQGQDGDQREQRDHRPRYDGQRQERDVPVRDPVQNGRPHEARSPEPVSEDGVASQAVAAGGDGTSEMAAEDRRPRRGRRPRRTEEGAATGAQAEAAQIEIDRLPPAFAPAEPAPRGRRKAAVEAAPEQAEDAAQEGEPAPRRRRTRRASAEDSNVAA